MSEWSTTRLAQLIASHYPGEWGTEPQGNNRDSRVVRSTEFNGKGGLELSTAVPRAVDRIKHRKKFLRTGDIVLEKSGGSPDQPVGRVAYFHDGNGHDFIGSNFTEKLEVASAHDSKFVFYLLSYNYDVGTVLKYQQQTTGIINFKLRDYLDEVVKTPRKEVQSKISTVLSDVDLLIDQTESLISKYQSIKQGLMHDLFTRGIDENGKLRPRYEDAPQLYKKTELGWVPKEWEVRDIKSVSTKVTDGDHHTPRREEYGIYLLSARNVLDGSLALKDVDFVGESEYARMIRRCHPCPGDILISCSGTVGRVCAVPEGIRCVLVRSAALVKPNVELVTSRFLEWALRGASVQSQILRSQLQAAQPNLFQGAIERLQIACPLREEQCEIARRLDRLEKTTHANGELLQKLLQLKQGLMHDLLTGKVPVKLKSAHQKAA